MKSSDEFHRSHKHTSYSYMYTLHVVGQSDSALQMSAFGVVLSGIQKKDFNKRLLIATM